MPEVLGMRVLSITYARVGVTYGRGSFMYTSISVKNPRFSVVLVLSVSFNVKCAVLSVKYASISVQDSSFSIEFVFSMQVLVLRMPVLVSMPVLVLCASVRVKCASVSVKCASVKHATFNAKYALCYSLSGIKDFYFIINKEKYVISKKCLYGVLFIRSFSSGL